MIYEDDGHDTKEVKLISIFLSSVRRWKGPDDSKGGWWCPTTPTYVSAGGSLEATLVGHTGNVNSVAYSHDGKHIASGSDDKTIKVGLECDCCVG